MVVARSRRLEQADTFAAVAIAVAAETLAPADKGEHVGTYKETGGIPDCSRIAVVVALVVDAKNR